MTKYPLRSLVVLPALAVALALALPRCAAAQTSDITEARPQPQAGAQKGGFSRRRHAWQHLPQYGGRASQRHATSHMNMPGAMSAAGSDSNSSRDALIGIDPDLSRPLVPCDALGKNARGARRSLGGGSGETAGAGYDPASGIGSLSPAVSSCVSERTSRDDVSTDERSTSVYQQRSPDVADWGSGSHRPGTLTVLRPFAH